MFLHLLVQNLKQFRALVHDTLLAEVRGHLDELLLSIFAVPFEDVGIDVLVEDVQIVWLVSCHIFDQLCKLLKVKEANVNLLTLQDVYCLINEAGARFFIFEDLNACQDLLRLESFESPFDVVTCDSCE